MLILPNKTVLFFFLFRTNHCSKCIYYTAHCECLVEGLIHLANWMPYFDKGGQGVQVKNYRILSNQWKYVVWSKNNQIFKLDALYPWMCVQPAACFYHVFLPIAISMSFVILAQLSFYSVHQIQSVCCYLPKVWILNQSIRYFGIWPQSPGTQPRDAGYMWCDEVICY